MRMRFHILYTVDIVVATGYARPPRSVDQRGVLNFESWAIRTRVPKLVYVVVLRKSYHVRWSSTSLA